MQPLTAQRNGGCFSCKAFAAFALLGGCVDGSSGLSVSQKAELSELQNTQVRYIIARSTPSYFVEAFSKYCLGDYAHSSDVIHALKAAGYVEVIGPNNGAHLFVVNSEHPAVMLFNGPQSRICAVSAAARTGQYNRVNTMIKDMFPDAFSPSEFGNYHAEQLWVVQKDPLHFIYTSRHKRLWSASSFYLGDVYTLAITKNNPSDAKASYKSIH